MYRSDDHGGAWQNVSGSSVDGENMIVNIAVSPINPDLLYVATSPNPFNPTNDPKLYKSSDGGLSWDFVGSQLPRRMIKDIAIDPLDDNKVYVVFSGFGSEHLAVSLDGANSWELKDNLPDLPTHTILIDDQKTDHLYIGNDLGIFFSPDRGETFEWFSNDFADGVMAMHLSISKANRKVRLASHGRGVYEKDLVFQEAVSNKAIAKNLEIELYPNPARELIYIDLQNHDFEKGSVQVFDMTGSLVINKQINQKGENFEIDISALLPGAYQLILEEKNKRGQSTFIKK